jgi:hypothetical protein
MPSLSRFDLEFMAKRAASDYLQNGRDLDDCISALAGESGATREQVQRIVETANTFVNANLVKQAKADNQDPRISFKLANADDIMAKLMGERPAAKLAHDKGVQKLASVFHVDAPKHALSVTESMGFSEAKVADVRPRQTYESPTKLALAYVQGQVADATQFSPRTLGDACIELASLRDNANVKCAAVVNQADDLAGSLSRLVTDLMNDGTTPATLRDLMKRAKVSGRAVSFADAMITKCASATATREGTTQIVADTLITRDHDFFVMLRKADEIWKQAEIKSGLRDKIVVAEGKAKADWARMVRVA